MNAATNGSRSGAAVKRAGAWNRRIRRFNRAILNPLMLRVADRWRGSYPAVVRHVGRRSGRAYRTPVVARPVADGFVIPLPYGVDTDWCRNVRAAGRFTLQKSGTTSVVGDLALIGPEAAAALVGPRVLRAWRRFGIDTFLRVRTLASERRPRAASGEHLSTNAWRTEFTMDQEEAKQCSDRVTGVSNVAYDLMVVLTNKLEGVAAIEEYKLDAEAAGASDVRAAFERIKQRARQDIDELRDLLQTQLQHIQRP